MRPTSPAGLLLAVAVGAGLGYLLGVAAYFDLPPLPASAAGGLLLLAALDLGVAKVVRDRLRPPGGRLRAGRPLHPLQAARAAVLGRASSVSGSALLGFYGGLFLYAFARRVDNAAAARDTLVAGGSALAALLLAVAGLLLERACRTPRVDR